MTTDKQIELIDEQIYNLKNLFCIEVIPED